MEKKHKLFKPLDYLILLISIVICILSIIYAFSNRGGTPHVIITTPQGEFMYQLDTDQVLEFEGHIGISQIEIVNGTARFLHSPCSNKTCVASMPISHNGEWSACLPNGIFMRIEGQSTNNSDIDIMVS